MPTSYQAPMRKDTQQSRHVSQTQQSNLSQENTSVSELLKAKGDALFSISPEDTLHTAVQSLSEKKIGALVVTDSAGKLCGILSERDIVRKLAEKPGETLPLKVADVMTKDVVTCAPDDALVTVLQRMTNGRFRHMPVLANGALAGIVTIGDVVNLRLTQLEHEALQLKQLIVG